MKNKILFIVFFGLLNSLSFSQEPDKTNYITGKIHAPIVVDKITTVDHFLDDRRDSNTKDTNVSHGIYTELKFIPIYLRKMGSFYGSYIEEVNDFITEIHISGRINFETNLGRITVNQTVTKNVKARPMNVCDYDYEQSSNYEYIDLKISKGIAFGNQKDKNVSYLFKPSENTKLTVRNYKYIEDTKCPQFYKSKEFIYKNINEESLKGNLAKKYFPFFTFKIYWDGKTRNEILKESIAVTEVRGEDPNWEPPSTSYLKESIEAEPNSIAVYYNEATVTNTTNAKIKGYNLGKGMAALLITDLSKVPGLKVLERMRLDKIVQEIELSESGLVKENSKAENKLMKEEIAVKIELEIDIKNNQIKVKCNIISKNKEILITTNYLPMEEIFGIQKEITKEIIKEVNKQFNMNIDPEIIFR